MQSDLPHIWCDFNACGWGNIQNDNDYFVFSQTELNQADPQNKKRVFLYDFENDEETEIVGCEAILDLYKGAWRAIADEKTWYSGRKFWK